MIFDKIIYFGLLSIVFLTPIIFDPYCYDSFELAKITFVRIVSLIIIFAIYFKIKREKPKKIKINYLYLPIFFYIALQIITTLHSSDIISSLKGTHKRQEGFFTIINYVFLFYVAEKFIDKEKIKNFLLAGVFSATAISIYAIFQHFGIDFHQREFDRSFSTLAHPNFLGAYLTMIIPFAVYFVFSKTTKFYIKITFIVSMIIMFTGLLFTYSRASWIGFFVSTFLFFLIFLIYNKGIILQNKNIILPSLIILILITVAISIHTQKRESFTITKRALSIFSVKSDRSIGARFSVWKSAMKMIREKPVSGWGIDTFKTIFPRYKLKDYVQYEGVRITADKAHNETIHISATQGFLGLFAYLWIIVIFYYKIFSNLKKNDILIPILCSTTAYLVQNQFSFSVIAIGVLFWIFLGFGWNLTKRDNILEGKKIKFAKKEKKKRENVQQNYIRYFLVASILILFALSSLRFYIADKYFLKGFLSASYQDFDFAILNYQKAIQLNPYEEFYYVKIAEAYESKNDLYSAEKYFKEALKVAPLNAYNHSKLTKIYAMLAKKTGEEKYFAKSEQSIKQALKLDPYNPVFLNNLGALYNDRGKPEKALPYLKKSLGFSPDYNFALTNIGKSYILLKEYKSAIPYLKKAISVDSSNIMTYKNLAFCYIELNEKEKARKILQEALRLFPEDEEVKKNLEILK